MRVAEQDRRRLNDSLTGDAGKEKPPLVSVVIPCFNAERFVAAAIRSVREQGYSNLEIVAVDDGSTDGTLSMLEEMGDPVRVVRLSRNCGLAAARNAGSEAARGVLVVALDADDTLQPGALTALVAAATANPDARFVIPHVDMVDASGGLLRAYPPEPYRLDLHDVLAMRIPISAGLLIRDPSAPPPVRYDEAFRADTGRLRARLSRGGHRSSSRPRILEDWVLWIDAAAQGLRAAPAPAARARYIRHNLSSLTADTKMRWRDGLCALEHGRRVGLRVHGDCAECRAALARGRRFLAEWCLSRDWPLIFDPGTSPARRARSLARVVARRDLYSTFIVARTCAWKGRDAARAALARRQV